MLDASIPVTLEMNIANTYHTAEPDSFNIVAEIPGTSRRQEVIIVGAHFDSWHGGTGAADNAAGCSVALEAIRILKALKLETRRTIRLVLWTGSEQGLLGARAYVATHFADPTVMQPKPEHALMSAYVNLDGGRGPIRGLQVQGNEPAARALEPWLATVKEHGVAILSLATTRTSDHAAFDAVARHHPGGGRTTHRAALERRHLRSPGPRGSRRQCNEGGIVAPLSRQSRRADAAETASEARPEWRGTVVAGPLTTELRWRSRHRSVRAAHYCVAAAPRCGFPFGRSDARPDGRPSVNQKLPF
jgi:hypothetical protein